MAYRREERGVKPNVVALRSEFYPERETEVRILFDLRIPGSAERIHRERGLWQERSDIEALDIDHFILVIRPDAAVQVAA
jgi:hypothetical protein